MNKNFTGSDKKTFVILLIITFPYSSFSQNYQGFIANLTKPAPNVASLLKYAEVPVNTYNGTTSFSVPLYELKENDVSLPISASYFSNGLKVEEESSWIGLGWSLQAGGVIQHISGGTDKLSANIVPRNAINYDSTYNYDNTEVLTNSIEHGHCYKSGVTNTFEDFSSIMWNNPGKGFQYDMYMFNFDGYSGKCLMTRDGQFIDLGVGNIKFETIANNGGLKATTPNGNQYFFTTVGYSQSYTNMIPVFSYCYYLTKIVSPKSNEINLSYVQKTTKSLPHLSQGNKHGIGASNKFYSFSTSSISEYLLSEINSSSTKIVFTSSPRADVENSLKLDQIQVFEMNNTIPGNVVKTIGFTTDYFVGQSSYTDYLSAPSLAMITAEGYGTAPVSVIQDYRSKRLKLSSISINPASENLKYLFEYNTSPLPFKTSFAQDLWGYFNGITTNNNLRPNIDNLGYFDHDVPAILHEYLETSNRKSNETALQAGILTRITQPTGGYTAFKYEINQFEPLEGTSVNIQKVYREIKDFNSTTEKSIEFEVPNLAGQLNNQYIELTVNFFGYNKCCYYNSLPANNAQYCYCPGYYNSMTTTIHPNDERLYARLEKKSGSTWAEVRNYSRISPELLGPQTCGTANDNPGDGDCAFYNTNLNLGPGTYRMTVNYPDSMIGWEGTKWAYMKMGYYDYVPLDPGPQQNIGGGLRIASIADYNSSTQKVNEKFYSYSNGILMTKPVFYQGAMQDQMVPGGTSGVAPVTHLNYSCTTPILAGYCSPGASSGYFDEYATILSDAVVPYSFNANGTLVGYTNVDISYGINQIGSPNSFIGIESYNYKNAPDYRNNYFSELSGIPGARAIDNGSLIKKTTKKILNPGEANAPPYTVKEELFSYEVKDFKDYWAFKVSFPWVNCTPATLNGYFLHFYPIKTGKVRLKSKEEINYSSSEIPTPTVSLTTNYEYNSKHQLINEKHLNSEGILIEQKSYYPNDLLSGSQSIQMQELIVLNRIDSPVRSQSLVAGVKVSEQEIKFARDATTSNILLPKEVHSLKGTANVNTQSIENRQITFTSYDIKGNITQYSVENSFPVSILWGHNRTQPIARFENATNAQIATALGVSNLNAINESNMTAINNLRTNTVFSKCMITTYTYAPLVGVTSITDPKGDKDTYHYDNSNRLQFVKDGDGNILSENNYHYRQ